MGVPKKVKVVMTIEHDTSYSAKIKFRKINVETYSSSLRTAAIRTIDIFESQYDMRKGKK